MQRQWRGGTYSARYLTILYHTIPHHTIPYQGILQHTLPNRTKVFCNNVESYLGFAFSLLEKYEDLHTRAYHTILFVKCHKSFIKNTTREAAAAALEGSSPQAVFLAGLLLQEQCSLCSMFNVFNIFSTTKEIFPNFYFLAAPPSAESPDQIPEGFSKCYKKSFDLDESNHCNALLIVIIC